MKNNCPKCTIDHKIRSPIVRNGVFYRTSDGKRVQRYLCRCCNTSFSSATFDPRRGQKKRHKNNLIRKLLASNNSIRSLSENLNLNRTTVSRKLVFLAQQARTSLHYNNLLKSKAEIVEIDDLETFEHTKLKPLSVTLAIESGSRRILGFEVSRMPATGRLSDKSRRKYGARRDERRESRRRLLSRVAELCTDNAVVKSDSNLFYSKDIADCLKGRIHEQYKGRAPREYGHGELKKGGFDPLFGINHTFAMLRARINRLIRKTWCTTKKVERLEDHIYLYALFHNEKIEKNLRKLSCTSTT